MTNHLALPEQLAKIRPWDYWDDINVTTLTLPETLKLPRWWYCKYCYKCVYPLIWLNGELVICSKCGYGLAPLEDVIEAGSLIEWWNKICAEFHAHMPE